MEPETLPIYEIRIDGHLEDHWAGRLGEYHLERLADGTTRLWGPVVDQAALFGLINHLRDLGFTLISLQRV